MSMTFCGQMRFIFRPGRGAHTNLEVVHKRPFEHAANARFAALIADLYGIKGIQAHFRTEKPRLTPPTYPNGHFRHRGV
jgi:hypothetical protein